MLLSKVYVVDICHLQKIVTLKHIKLFLEKIKCTSRTDQDIFTYDEVYNLFPFFNPYWVEMLNILRVNFCV